MRWKRLKIYSRFNIFILAVLLLLGFSVLYFFYYRQRSQADVYVTINVLRPQTLSITAPFNWIPYWIEKSINIGDKEVSPLGGINAVVVNKEAYEAPAYGEYVYLLLQVKAIKDRSRVYLFKNKPLSAGAVIDLKLQNAQIQGLVTYIGNEQPKYEKKKITLTVKGRNMEIWHADGVRIGSSIVNNKGETLIKVSDKKVTLPESQVLQIDTSRPYAAYDKSRRDLEITLEILVKKIDDTYYFAETQKIKVNESLFLSFPEIGNLTLPITSIIQVKDSI